MLSLPFNGLSRSTTSHNIDYEICCDWIEASALFTDDIVSSSNISDILVENQVYKDKIFAQELSLELIARLRQRAKIIGAGYPLEFHSGPIVARRDKWEDFIPYSFCLVLSLAAVYPKWARSFGSNYTEQGALFERLAAEAVSGSFAGWSVYLTGWSRTQPRKITEVVKDVAHQLGEVTGDLLRWTKSTANEAGLDMLCHYKFPDGRTAVPVFLFQCASGVDWPTKLHTPALNIWARVIDFVVKPKKAFAMPFILDDKEFIRSANLVSGMFFDRHRILAPGVQNKGWITADLSLALQGWTTSRIATLPLAKSVI